MPKKCETPCLKLGQETLAIMKIAVSVLKVLVPMGNENSDPQERVLFVETAEIKIEVTFEKHLESKILKALYQQSCL
jgi:hypothetical protein